MKNYKLIILIVFLLSGNTIIKAQSATDISLAFERYSIEFNIPVDVLKAVAYVETRFDLNIHPNKKFGHNGIPLSFGIMGLHDDDWFGHSLIEASNLIKADPNLVLKDYSLNIKAAASLLSKYATELSINRKNLNQWKTVFELYSGIPQNEIKPFYSFDALKVLNEGTNINGISISSHPEVDISVFDENVNPKNKLKNIQDINSTDYPPAVWDPSPNFTLDSITQLFAVVHDTEGSFGGSLSWLKNPVAQASAHYIIRSSDGYIVQMVREQNKAWHVRSWNPYMLGVEHEGFVNNPAFFTEAMYQSSAALYRHFVQKFNIPLDRNHIIGHNEWQNPNWVNWINQNFPQIDPTDNTHTDPGPFWDWNHFISLIQSGAAAPQVVTSFPLNNDSAWVSTKIKITFDQAMLPTETQNAFSISPNVFGSFSWEDNNKTLVFIPDALLAPSTTYSVTISKNALSILNTNLQSDFNFTFTTRTVTPLTVVESYPANNGVNVSTTVKIIIKFNVPLIGFSTLAGNVLFTDSAGSSVTIKNASYISEENQGIVSFNPSKKLNYQSLYTVTIKGAVQSLNGNTLGDDFTITFTTEKNEFISGTLLDDFESLGGWNDPLISNETFNADSSQTNFFISTSDKVNGNSSGKLNYGFKNGDGGVIQLVNSQPFNLGTDKNNLLGLWINGDFSKNFLELWFDEGFNENIIIKLDTLNFTGWKFFEFPLSKVGGTESIFFHSIVIRQNPNASKKGSIYFDDIQTRIPSVTAVEQTNNQIPKSFYLEQNFPNPFNPSTTINYGLKSQGKVLLKIYDVLGREVTSLVNETQQPGNYSVNFNAANLSSGIYFYQLSIIGSRDNSSENIILTKKMILMR